MRLSANSLTWFLVKIAAVSFVLVSNASATVIGTPYGPKIRLVPYAVH